MAAAQVSFLATCSLGTASASIPGAPLFVVAATGPISSPLTQEAGGPFVTLWQGLLTLLTLSHTLTWISHKGLTEPHVSWGSGLLFYQSWTV